MENQEIDHPAQRGADKDPARVMIVQASSAQLSTEEMKHFRRKPKRLDEELRTSVQPKQRAVAEEEVQNIPSRDLVLC